MSSSNSKTESDEVIEKRLKFIKKIQQSSASSVFVNELSKETSKSDVVKCDEKKSYHPPQKTELKNSPPVIDKTLLNSQEKLIGLIEKVLKISFISSEKQRNLQDDLDMSHQIVENHERSMFLDFQYIEGFIVEAVKSKSVCGAINYLMECYERCLQFEILFQNAKIYITLRRSLVTQLYMLLMVNEEAQAYFFKYIESVCSKLVDTVNNFKLTHNLLTQMTELIPFEDQFNIFFERINQILHRLSKLTLMDDFIPLIKTISVLNVPLKDVIADDYYWSDNLQNSFLASIASIKSMYVPEIVNKLTPVNMTWSAELNENLKTIQQSNCILRNVSRDILKSLLKNSKLRSKLFQWLNKKIFKNNTRRASTVYRLQLDAASKYYDNLFCNLTEWFAELCCPMVNKFDVYSLIDLQYLDYYEYNNMPKLWAEHTERQLNSDYLPSFVSSTFFSTHLLIHYGLMPVIQRYYMYLNELSDQSFTNDNDSVRQIMQVKIGVLYSMRARLLDPEFVNSMLMLCKLTSSWFIKLNESYAAIPDNEFEQDDSVMIQSDVSNVDDMRNAKETGEISLEADVEKSPVHILIPEFLVENVCEYLLFLSKSSTKPNPLVITDLEWELPPLVLKMMICLIGDSSIRNYHLRCQCVEVLIRIFSVDHLIGRTSEVVPANEDAAVGSLAADDSSKSKMRYKKDLSLFGNDGLAIKGLMKSLFKLYYDAEHNGGTNGQFYDKFSFRHHIGIMVCKLLEYAEYVKDLEKLQLQGKFKNCLIFSLNDALFLLDELIIKLRKLRELKIMLRTLSSNAESNSVNNMDKTEIEQEIVKLVAQTDNYAIFGQRAIYLIKKLTKHCTKSFAANDVVNQLSVMLNYFLYYLTGEKTKDISFKQENQKLKQSLRKILDNLIKIYLNCWNNSKGTEFVDAIARESRTFNINMFFLAVDFIAVRSIISSKELDEFRRFVEVLKTRSEVIVENENIFEDIPEEFTDSILSTLMTDPVTLPSGNNVDRSTILRHLSGNNATDPFTRKPLNINMLKSNTELKQKIQQWLRQKKSSN